MSQILRTNQSTTRVLIDSRRRNDPSSSTSTNFTFNLDREVKRVRRIQLVSIQVPFTYYVINSSNSVIEISAGVGNLPSGNYNLSTMLNQLKITMDAIGGGPYTLAVSNTSHKLTITSSTAFQVLTGAANNIAHILGFTEATSLLTSVIANSIISLNGPKFLVLKSSLLTQYIADPSAVAESSIGGAIVHTMAVKGVPTDILIDEPISNASLELTSKQTFGKNIDFQLEDDYGNILDLNGETFSCQFLFHTE
jgi:hypothetical protein